ncbi:PREDICTED: uncharacterized protein LOC109209590 isoform X2 [Nicotiana attenuata]|uniref:uncharacterized protein LOC109209590 isoform X2 n=1 Tax=Nicotiana attenuata TaxID=49451 RepID=UPI000904A6BA|nr:PREDICTED: uncharacterized protein LOC109209590 isoform X2 [Nicotiana attenuata]
MSHNQIWRQTCSRLMLIIELHLLRLMERRGFGQEYINRYKMITRFHHLRVPLVILVCGTACVGKSTIATQLAQRLNLPNVLQTDMVYELLRTSTDAPLASSPVWGRDFSSPEELITEFCRECRIVRKGLAGDLKKAMKDGKPIIIEGIHLDPSIYLMDEENKLPPSSPANQAGPKSLKVEEHKELQQKSNCNVGDSSQSDRKDFCSEDMNSEQSSESNKLTAALKSLDIVNRASENTGETVKDSGADQNPSHRSEKCGAQPIIVPIVLRMAEFDHKALLEEWVATRTCSEKYPTQDKDKLISNLKTIQDYLCSFTSQGLTVVNISATTFPQTLDWLHNHLLQCIEQGTAQVSRGTNEHLAKD